MDASRACFFAMIASAVAAASPAVAVQRVSKSSANQIRASFSRTPLRFEPNLGQTDPCVQFLSRGELSGIFLTRDEAILTLPMVTGPNEHDVANHGRAAVIHMKIAGANKQAKAEGLELQSGITNYYSGVDPSTWRTNVPGYGKVRFAGIYPGIDLVYYGNQRNLEYDFVVAPRADLSQIRLQFTGADGLRVDTNGDLLIRTAAGELRQHRPIVFQETSGIRNQVTARYVLIGNRQAAFHVDSYDRSRPLVIDPTMAFSTYLGGNGGDYPYGAASDSSGNLYLAGASFGGAFPGTSARTFTYYYYAFVTKLNASGSSVVYTDLFGNGGSNTIAYAVALDTNANAYVTGCTMGGMPVTSGAFQSSSPGGQDAFVTKVNGTGSVVFSTYLGGSGKDTAYGIAVDSSGNTWVSGATYSTNLPLVSAFQSTNKVTPLTGGQTGFVSKLSNTGGSLLFSSYLGGSSGDQANAIAVDSSGSAYITGGTSSADFPTTTGAFQKVSGGAFDAFVSKFTSNGSIVYSTFVGGSNNDMGNGIAVDGSGNAYITGYACSANFPLKNAIAPINANIGYGRAIVTKLNATGSGILYSTWLGGTSSDGGSAIALDGDGHTFVVGSTVSTDFKVTSDALQPSYGGNHDAFVAEIDTASSGINALLYSSYFGGSSIEHGYALALHSNSTTNSLYLTGDTASKDLGLVNAVQSTLTSMVSYPNCFVSRIDFPIIAALPPTPTVTITAPANNATVGGTVTISATVSDTIAAVKNVAFYLDSSTTPLATVTTGPTYSYSWNTSSVSSGTHTIKAIATDLAVPANTPSDSITVTVSNNKAPTVATAASATPSTVTGTTTSLSVLGADDGGEANLIYTWSATGPAAVTFSPNGTNAAKNATATFTKAGAYTFTATIKDAGGLSCTSTVNVTVSQKLTVTVTPSTATVVTNATKQFSASESDQFGTLATQPTFTWSVSGGGTMSSTGLFTAGGTTGGPYTVTATGGGASGTASVTVGNHAPTVATAASATPSTVVGTTTSVSVLGADDGGEANLTYTWSATGPAAVTFSPNGTNAAKDATATFTKAGAYTFTATIKDAGGLSCTSTVNVTVSQTASKVTVSPGSASVKASNSQQFAGTVYDQFNATIGSPAITWSVSGGGTIDTTGLFKAGATPGGPFNVTASIGVNGTASVTVVAAGDTTPPTASITSTKSQGNNLTVKVSANDNVKVVKVELYVDGALSSSQTAAAAAISTSFSVSTGQWIRGSSHTLVAKAYDAAGNVGTSTTVTVKK